MSSCWLAVARDDARAVEDALEDVLRGLGREVTHGRPTVQGADTYAFAKARNGLVPISVTPPLRVDLDVPCELSKRLRTTVWLIDQDAQQASSRQWCFDEGRASRAHEAPPPSLLGRAGTRPVRSLSAMNVALDEQRSGDVYVPYGVRQWAGGKDIDVPLEQIVAESVTPGQLAACLRLMTVAEGRGFAEEARAVLDEGGGCTWRAAVLVHRVAARLGVGVSTWALRCFTRALEEKNERVLEAARALLHAAPDPAIQVRISLLARASDEPETQHALMVLYDELCAQRE